MNSWNSHRVAKTYMDRIRINLLWIFSTDEMSSIDQILSITAARNPSETFENWKFLGYSCGVNPVPVLGSQPKPKMWRRMRNHRRAKRAKCRKENLKIAQITNITKTCCYETFQCGKRLNQWDVGGLTYRYHTFVFRMVERTADPSCSGDKFNQCDVGIGTYFCTQSRYGWKFGNQIPCV